MDRLLLPEEEDTVDFLGPIDDDNPLCPRNVDKVKSLLKQLNLEHDKNNESKSDREFFQRLFKPYVRCCWWLKKTFVVRIDESTKKKTRTNTNKNV